MKKFLLATAALGLLGSAAMASPIDLDPNREYKMIHGCLHVKAENGNYWSKPTGTGDCPTWKALGFDRQRDMLGWDKDEDKDEEEPGTEEPGDGDEGGDEGGDDTKEA